MGAFRIFLVAVTVAAGAAPMRAQGPAGACLHMGLESPAEAQRRDEALAAVRMINSLLVRPLPGSPATTAYPTWEALVNSPRLPSLRGMGGRAGDLARKIMWGTSQPLPDWNIHYVANDTAYAFSLTDVSDPCRFTYSTNDRGVIVEGQPIMRRGSGIVPIT